MKWDFKTFLLLAAVGGLVAIFAVGLPGVPWPVELLITIVLVIVVVNAWVLRRRG